MSPDRPISDLFEQKRPLRSLEFFPPKDDAGVESLRTAAATLKRMNPDFVSVTYGAGGSTREKTIELVSRIERDFGLEAMAHLTCVNATVADLRATLRGQVIGPDDPGYDEARTVFLGGIDRRPAVMELRPLDPLLSAVHNVGHDRP